MTMVKRFVAAALFTGAAFAANADTAWMVLPRYSKSGRTMLQCCRTTPKPRRLMLRLEKPEKDGKYRYLSIGQKDGFRFGGINECGVATIYTGGGPMLDKNPPKSPQNFTGRRAITEILHNCASAAEAEALIRAAAGKKLIEGALIIFVIDRNHAWVIECSPENFVSWELPHAFCAYSNLWKLPGMDGSSTGTVERTLKNCQREWAVRETLRRRLDANKTISFADSFAASRLNTHDLNGEEYAKARSKTGSRKFDTAPYNSHSLDSYLMEVDPEFGELSCIFVAYGPARHTVYLPVPFGAADALPEELFGEEWLNSAFARMKAAKPGDPVDPAIIEFEAKLLADFHKAREEARWKLRNEKIEDACKILRECLKKQAADTLKFLKTLPPPKRAEKSAAAEAPAAVSQTPAAAEAPVAAAPQPPAAAEVPAAAAPQPPAAAEVPAAGK